MINPYDLMKSVDHRLAYVRVQLCNAAITIEDGLSVDEKW